MLLVMTAAVAACIAGCSKEDIEAAREAGTNAVSKVADKTIELSDEAKGVVDRTKEHIHERIVKMPKKPPVRPPKSSAPPARARRTRAGFSTSTPSRFRRASSSARRTAKNKPYPRNAQKKACRPVMGRQAFCLVPC